MSNGRLFGGLRRRTISIRNLKTITRLTIAGVDPAAGTAIYVDINTTSRMSNLLANELEAADCAVPYEATLYVRDNCLCLHAQRAARRIARRFDEALRPLALKSGQFSILMSLNRPDAPTLGSVAQLLAMDRTTLTANLKPLARDALLEVRTDETDKRARRLALTAKGRVLLAEALPIWIATHRAIEAALPEGSSPGHLRGDLSARF